MQRLLSLCLWQVVFVGMIALSMPVHAFEESGIQIRGPKNTDPFPYGRYGAITGQDTLWRIATAVRPDPGLSLYQVMQALYQANPQAFADNNINHIVEGEMLRIPAFEEIARINKTAAKRYYEQNEKSWGEKLSTQGKSEEQVIKKKDLEAAKSEINNQLQTYGDSQQQRLSVIQNDVADSIDGLQAILKENAALRDKLTQFNQQLTLMQQEVAKSEEIKPQLDQMSKLLQEMYAKAAEQERLAMLEKERENSFSNILLNILMATVPALLLVGGGLFFVIRRKKSALATDEEETVSTKKVKKAKEPEDAIAAVSSEDDELTLDNELSLDDELSIDLAEGDDDLFADDLDADLGSDELLDDDVIHLDDDLDDLDDLEDISLDLDDDAEELEGGTLGQGDLDSLLSGLDDDGDEEEPEALDGGELGQGDLDALLSGLDDDESESDVLPGGELSAGDLDALFAEDADSGDEKEWT